VDSCYETTSTDDGKNKEEQGVSQSPGHTVSTRAPATGGDDHNRSSMRDLFRAKRSTDMEWEGSDGSGFESVWLSLEAMDGDLMDLCDCRFEEVADTPLPMYCPLTLYLLIDHKDCYNCFCLSPVGYDYREKS